MLCLRAEMIRGKYLFSIFWPILQLWFQFQTCSCCLYYKDDSWSQMYLVSVYIQLVRLSRHVWHLLRSANWWPLMIHLTALYLKLLELTLALASRWQDTLLDSSEIPQMLIQSYTVDELKQQYRIIYYNNQLSLTHTQQLPSYLLATFLKLMSGCQLIIQPCKK